MCCVSLLSERGGASVDHFDIVERVEMGQMASMFFNKGEYSMPTLTAVRLKRNSFDFPLTPPLQKKVFCVSRARLYSASPMLLRFSTSSLYLRTKSLQLLKSKIFLLNAFHDKHNSIWPV